MHIVRLWNLSEASWRLRYEERCSSFYLRIGVYFYLIWYSRDFLRHLGVMTADGGKKYYEVRLHIAWNFPNTQTIVFHS